jgi:Tfp pilus assembly protein PilV
MTGVGSPNDDGFSAVEALITLFIAALFATIFFQLRGVIVQNNATATQKALASSLAYSKLREITAEPAGFVCDNNSDLTVNASAAGWTVSTTTYTGTIALPGTITGTVLAFAPRGCAANQPILIKSVIQYGTNPVTKVSHATYVPGT